MSKALFLSHTVSSPGDITEETKARGSFLASVRLQLLPALRAAESMGMKTQVLALRSERPEQIELIGTPSICVVGKLSHPDADFQARVTMANLAALTRLRRQRVPVVVVYSDHLADLNTQRGLLYRDLLDAATTVVVPCNAMVPYARRWMPPGGHCTVIKDPLQVTMQPFPPLNPEEPVRLIWFGHAKNVRYLLKVLPALAARCRSWSAYELTVLSSPSCLRAVEQRLNSLQMQRSWRVRPVGWRSDDQPGQLERELARAHIALLPSDPKDPQRASVSHNRAADALQGGCVVAGSSLPSYRELAKGMLLGENLAILVDGACSQYERLIAKYSKLRQELLKEFQPSWNHSRWRTELKKACLAKEAASQSAEPKITWLQGLWHHL